MKVGESREMWLLKYFSSWGLDARCPDSITLKRESVWLHLHLGEEDQKHRVNLYLGENHSLDSRPLS